MNANEKAPVGTAIPNTGASEINHLQDTPDYSNCQEPVDLLEIGGYDDVAV